MKSCKLDLKQFQKLFVEIFFCNLKVKEGLCLENFKSVGDTEVYRSYFNKFNSLVPKLKTGKKANNRLQRLRVYAFIQRAVGIYYIYIRE